MMKSVLVSLGLLGSVSLADATKPTKIEIQVTRKGFEPASITVPAKQPVELVFKRTTDQTCTKSVVLSLDDGKTIEKALPLDTPVPIDVTFPKAGTLRYACSMNMAKGIIVVR